MSEETENLGEQLLGCFTLIIIIAIGMGIYHVYSNWHIWMMSDEEFARYEQQLKKEEEEKRYAEYQAFIAPLARNQGKLSLLDKSLVAPAQTEMQEERVRKQIVDKYWWIEGTVDDIIPKDREYEYTSTKIQLTLGNIFTGGVVVHAQCWLTVKELNSLANVEPGDSLRIRGKVWDYGDWVGVQVSNCTL